MEHVFRLTTSWLGAGDGRGEIAGEGLRAPFGMPSQMGGEAGKTSPEELLLAALAACYSITLAVLAERRRIAVSRVDVEIEGVVEQQLGGTLKLHSVGLQPSIHATKSDEAGERTLMELARKAEQYCVISNAIRGNVAIHLDPRLISA